MKLLTIIAAVVLALHGFVHLMGTTVYLRLGTIEALPYKTTLLGGRRDLGPMGIGMYGALWAVAVAGFVVAALAFGFGWGTWQGILLGVTLFSLLLTALDWQVALAGVALNLAILLLLELGPRLATWVGA